MLNYHKNYFNNKKITLMGLGVLGRGVNLAKFLVECGASLIVTDLKAKTELKSSVKKLQKYKNIKFVLGKHRLRDFRNRDMILRAPNAPLDSPYLAEARRHKIPIKMDASLFCELAPDIITIGVTGTRGKTTTTYLIYEILKEAKKRVWLAGNIKGLATLPLLAKVRPSDIVLMELDSWQLQGFGEAKISPHIAVFTNFMRDHMNYYKGDMRRYRVDKENIFKYQKRGDYLIRGESLKDSNLKTKLLGQHNKRNIACAVEVAKILKIKKEIVKRVVANFKGVPGRLEFVRAIKGVKYYNDTMATTPDATIAALRALNSRNVILIAGGADKELDYKQFAKVVPKYVKKLILLKGTATEKMPKAKVVSSMKQAVAEARKAATRGDIILLSPAAASFGLFKNEYDRGDQFVKLVRVL